MSFWDVVWFILITFAFVFYLMVLFWILSDLFRDRDTNGWVKAVWVLALLVFPLLTALVYLIARGRGMSERQARAAAEAKKAQDEYIRDVAGKSMTPADQIAQARAMLDAGVISQTEFDRLKEKALV
jgi:type VI protein secretion system component VasK